MAAQLKVPESPKQYKEVLAEFKGVDFAHAVSDVAKGRSPNAVNMISDLSGKIEKRPGYKTVATHIARINGIHRLKTVENERILVHSGSKLFEYQYNYEEDKMERIRELGVTMNDAHSVSFQHEKKMYLLDGEHYYVYGEENDAFSVKNVADDATIPTVAISMNPNGTGGVLKDGVNVLTQKRTYSFFGTATDKTYHISADDSVKIIDDTPVKVELLGADSKWTETTAFTVDRAKGTITFTNAPGESPGKAGGIDNIHITVEVEQDDDSYVTADLVRRCTIAIQYGVNGSADRVFVSGNPDAPHFQYWSAINDPAYFPSENYMYLGQDSSAIMGYSIINDTLVVHKDDNQQDKTTFMVSGTYNEATKKEIFRVTGSIAGVGAISKHCFKRLDTEPLFLSANGVYAITTQYLTVERYAQNRSYYVNPRLVNEPGLQDAVAIEFNNYYYLAVNGHCYVADGRQKAYEENAPQTTFQYEWYYLDNIPARVWFEHDNHLYFGTEYGEIKRFHLATEDTATNPVYNDDGEAIYCCWDTPYFTCDFISRLKTLKGFWVMCGPVRRSAIDILYKFKGNMIQAKKTTTLDIFDFNDINFERFTFITDDSPLVVATNRKAKKFVTIMFRLSNGNVNDGLSFYRIEWTYVMNGKNKG